MDNVVSCLGVICAIIHADIGPVVFSLQRIKLHFLVILMREMLLAYEWNLKNQQTTTTANVKTSKDHIPNRDSFSCTLTFLFSNY